MQSIGSKNADIDREAVIRGALQRPHIGQRSTWRAGPMFFSGLALEGL